MNFKDNKVVLENGIPLISVGGEVFTGMAFTLLPERRSAEYVKLLIDDAKIKLWFPIIKCEWCGYEDETKYDFSGIEMILAEDPGALIIPRFALMPPRGWKDKYPEELAVAGNSVHKEVRDFYSVASEQWLLDACDVLRSLIGVLNDKAWAENIIGIFTGVGSHTEGGGWSCYMEKECYDFSEPNRIAFIDHLKHKYKSFEQVRKLCQKPLWCNWNDITVPEFEERMVADMGMFHDPAEGGVYVREYRIFENKLNSSRLDILGKTVKDASEGCLLYGCFHGYCGRAFGGGGSDLHGTLHSENIDFLAAPPAYGDRAPGGSITHSMPIDSINLHGKIFFNECDVRTSIAELQQKKYGAPKSIRQSCENIRHFVGYTLAHCNYGWYLEPGTPTEKEEKWFDNKELAAEMAKLNDLFCKYIKGDIELKPEIAVVWDKFGGLDTTFTIQGDVSSEHFSNPGSQLINEMLRMEVNRIGAPVGMYLMEDLLDGSIPESVKFMIFVNTWGMTKNKRTRIAGELEKRKCVELWFYGSGVVDYSKNELSLKAMNELLKMDFSIDDNWGTMEITLNDEGRGFFREANEPFAVPYRFRKTGLGLHKSFTPSKAPNDFFAPFFAVNPDANIISMGHYQKNGLSALAKTITDKGRRIFYSGSPFMAAGALRNLAEFAGVNFISDAGNAVYGNSRLDVVHLAENVQDMYINDDAVNGKKGKTLIYFKK
jgi:hypothetical protein